MLLAGGTLGDVLGGGGAVAVTLGALVKVMPGFLVAAMPGALVAAGDWLVIPWGNRQICCDDSLGRCCLLHQS